MSIELPHCTETEFEVLAIVLHNKASFFDITTAIKPEHFYHKEIGQALEFLIKLDEQGKPTDPISAVRESTNQDVTDVILKAMNQFISAERVNYLIDRFQDLHMRRTYYKIGHKLQSMAFDTSIPPSKLVDEVETEIMGIHSGDDKKDIIEPRQAAIKAMEVFYERQGNQSPIGISFSTKTADGLVHGFPGVDEALSGGAQPGDAILIAAETGDGKTALAVNLATYASVFQAKKTYYQNTEMKEEELVFRVVSNLSGIPFTEVFTGKLTGEPREILDKQARLEKAFNLYSQSNIYLSDLPELTAGQSKGLARKFKHRYGQLDVLVIDYIGRLETDGDMKKGLQEHQVLARIAKESKKLAKMLNCVVIILAQLTEDRKLEGARRILNDMDLALFVEVLDNKDKAEYPVATHWLRKRKTRRSGKGSRDILIKFDKPIQRISEVYTQRKGNSKTKDELNIQVQESHGF
ncbi:replicative DNA helicase [Brevibacillus reuszeri]|uniref:replicative DNA helicase n=1 Tax=Brevibacillus reuszeri TaxID=54915 RepID=UPI0013E055E3|nr:DnaB-like helicase C-terminal domain-containing protein [Brevibacillus reuszeri]